MYTFILTQMVLSEISRNALLYNKILTSFYKYTIFFVWKGLHTFIFATIQ